MARSYKKGWIKDSKPKDNNYNKIFRRKNKERVKLFKYPLLMNEVYNQYDVCDYIFYSGSPESKRK